ncbi:MAG: hypothetical protein RL354_2305, partial [Planctomycetota bacterium]|jgi:hypothetical protein
MHPLHAMRSSPAITSMLAMVGFAFLTGCVERRVWVDTDPPGALVWINDAQIGRSPVDVGITHDGVYDLRIEKEGYEPIVTGATVDGPLWDQPPLDFFAEILPVDSRNHTHWRFVLRARDESDADLAARAERFRERLRAE